MFEIKMRMNKEYGYGLINFHRAVSGHKDLKYQFIEEKDDTQPINPNKLYTETNADGTVTYNDVTFDPKEKRVFILGLVAGLQYNTDTYGECFYTTVDTVNYIKYFENDWNNLKQEHIFY